MIENIIRTFIIYYDFTVLNADYVMFEYIYRLQYIYINIYIYIYIYSKNTL